MQNFRILVIEYLTLNSDEWGGLMKQKCKLLLVPTDIGRGKKLNFNLITK